MRNNKLFLIIVIALFVSCDEVDTTQLKQSYDYRYFPVDSGDWREYSVLKIDIDADVDKYDTSEYFLREQLAGIFIDAANDSMQMLNRYFKDSIHHEWQLSLVGYLGIVNQDAIQVEENIKIVKQRYPLALNKFWDGNAYNHTDTVGEYSYTVTEIDIPYEINGFAFDSVLTITQGEYKETAIDKISTKEKYALNVGLVYKEEVDIYSDDIPDENIEERVTKGTMYYQKIIDYGKAN